MASMDYETENGRYEGMSSAIAVLRDSSHITKMMKTDIDLHIEEPRYERDRSASPRPTKREDDSYAPKRDDSYRNGRDRSASPNGRVDSRYVTLLEIDISY